MASRRAFLFPEDNLRSADSFSPWSFRRLLEATLSAFLRILAVVEVDVTRCLPAWSGGSL
jgi:hypothetical protein